MIAQRRQFRLTREQHELPAGTVVHEWWGHDFGCVRDDASNGLETYAVSVEPGAYPLLCCEVDALEPIDGLPPVRGAYTISEKK